MLAPDVNPYASPRHDASAPPARSMAEYVLAGCLTVDDAIAAYRLTTRGRWLRIAIGVSMVATLSMLVTILAVTAISFSRGLSIALFFVAGVICPALLVAPVAVRRARLRRFARMQYGMFGPTCSTFSPSKILVTEQNAKSELQWALFSHCVSNETVAVLFFKNSQSQWILARGKLQDPAQWDDFLSMIQAQLAPPVVPRQ